MNAGPLSSLLRLDARTIVRDPLLTWILLLPIGIALALRVALPIGRAAIMDASGVDPAPFYPLVMSGYLLTAPGLVGMVVGFLLLDERDARTLTALRVTPLSTRRYLAYRIVLPLAGGTLTTLVGYPLAGSAPVPFPDLLVIAALSAMAAPILALVLATAAPNKVAGFAVIKVSNALNLLPVAAFFLPLPLQLAAGVIPAYWPMRALWSAAAGEAYAGYVLAGALSSAAVLALVALLFERTLSGRPWRAWRRAPSRWAPARRGGRV